MKLIKKIFINGKIELLTGLHIGGSSTALDIGGIDSNVIKNANGVPYIPGSSIKGKMRSLLEMKYSEYTQLTGLVDNGKVNMKEVEKKGLNEKEEDLKKKFNPKIQKLFGSVAKESDFKTRLIVRDAYLNNEVFEQMINKTGDFEKLELDYTEAKWEVSLDRLTSQPPHGPRQLERVPAGAKFDFSIVFTFYDETDKELVKMLFEGMQLLQDDYLGGSGSRGYGQIAFKDISISEKTAENYQKHEPAKEIKTKPTLDEIDINEIDL
ncbi:MAG TPA: type III-A CRISPR-associated RAMP protein Csm3 [Candidatus Cloacimonetes bacterium]|nr:type III-A CRISPR-associated RAMP protein Csm3 [Candidatus Cloacimonadota bacterium]